MSSPGGPNLVRTGGFRGTNCICDETICITQNAPLGIKIDQKRTMRLTKEQGISRFAPLFRATFSHQSFRAIVKVTAAAHIEVCTCWPASGNED